MNPHHFLSLPRTVLLATFAAMSLTFIGCDKKPPVDEPSDELGLPISAVDQTYRRASAGIQIDIMHHTTFPGVVNRLGDFTEAEKAVIVKVLDGFSDDQLKLSGLYRIVPVLADSRVAKGFKVEAGTILFYSDQSSTVRKLDPAFAEQFAQAVQQVRPQATMGLRVGDITQAGSVDKSGDPAPTPDLDPNPDLVLGSHRPMDYRPMINVLSNPRLNPSTLGRDIKDVHDVTVIPREKK